MNEKRITKASVGALREPVLTANWLWIIEQRRKNQALLTVTLLSSSVTDPPHATSMRVNPRGEPPQNQTRL